MLLTADKVLHSYKLTRFSNPPREMLGRDQFYTLTNLQGSQTQCVAVPVIYRFYTLTNLQGSQTHRITFAVIKCFTLLQTYKVLKPSDEYLGDVFGFTLLQTYKVLKHAPVYLEEEMVLHSYKLTRFSNMEQ